MLSRTSPSAELLQESMPEPKSLLLTRGSALAGEENPEGALKCHQGKEAPMLKAAWRDEACFPWLQKRTQQFTDILLQHGL